MSDNDWRRALLPPALRLLASTWRWRLDVEPDVLPLLEPGSRAVFAFWHGQMFPIWYRLRTLRPAALVSASRDGSVLSSFLRSLGYRAVIRGSSSRHGREALHEAVVALATMPLLITPDGPRGPARQARAGAAVAALRAGVPLVICGWRASRSRRLRSWDQMEIPFPFAKVDLRLRRFPMPDAADDGRLPDTVLDELTRRMSDL